MFKITLCINKSKFRKMNEKTITQTASHITNACFLYFYKILQCPNAISPLFYFILFLLVS